MTERPNGLRAKPNRAEPIPAVMKTVAITFHVPEDVQQRLVELASANERTVSGELRVAVKSHLDKSGAK